MEEQTQPVEDQGKEAKKIEAKFQTGLRKLTALMGPDWAKTTKLDKSDIPEVMQRLVAAKKEELYKKFETGYIDLVMKKKTLDKTEVEKRKEFEKVILDQKKAFNKEVDGLLSIITQMDEIEKDYYETLAGKPVTEDEGDIPLTSGL